MNGRHRGFAIALVVLGLLACSTRAECQAGATAGSAAAADLVRLVQAPGVSGYESDVREAIAALLGSWAKPRVDETGNLILTVGQGRPHLLVAVDVDEDGYVVSGITDDGYLRVQRITTGIGHRLYEQFNYGQPVAIRTSHGLVNGVFATASTHLLRGREAMATPRTLDDLWIDVGADKRSEVEKLGIQMLDPVVLRERAQVLAGSRVAGVAAQARGSALALVNLARMYSDTRPPLKAGNTGEGGFLVASSERPMGTLTLAWTTQGQFGERGLARLAQQIDPDRVILLVRTPPSREPDPKGATGKLGAGVLMIADVATQDLAKRENVGVQVVPTMRLPNTWPASKLQAFALPVLFAQTPVETVDLHDVASLTRLIYAAASVVAYSAGPAATAAPAAANAPPGADARTAAARPAGSAQAIETPAFFKTLRPLIEAYGPSGHESAVREALLKQLPKWATPETDASGNVTVTVGHGGKEMLFVAHLDEIGYEIVNVLEDGSASVRKLGGFLDMLLEAHPVLVHTAKGAVPAIVAPRPGYFAATEGPPQAQQIALYFGTGSRADTEALGVAKGDTATVRKVLAPLAGQRATARSMDNRCGMAALVEALARLDPAKLQNRVTFAWVVSEETGLVGSGALASQQHPAYVFAVDTFVSSNSPVDAQRFANIPLGTGAVIRAMDNSVITPPAVVARIAEVARAHKIPFTVGTTNGGNDGSMFTRYGSLVAPISWPGRYSHSAVEIADARDLGALVDLIVALSQTL
jgi:putative aminopeptidase FrvX